MDRKRPEQRVAQVEEVHPLVDELAAAGQGAFRPPLVLVADTAPVPVAAPHVRDRPEPPGRRLGDGARDRRMEPVVEANLDPAPGRLGRLGDTIDVRDPDSRRLLDEDVRTRTQCEACVVGERVVCHGHDDDVGPHREQVVDRHARGPAEPSRKRARGPRINVEAPDEGVVAERAGTFRPDRSAADETHPQGRPLGHVYSTP